MMEAKCAGMPEGEHGYLLEYVSERDLYVGAFNKAAAEQAAKLGFVVVTNDEDGTPALRLERRDEFLTSFAGGVLEARRGNDAYYASYASHEFAFAAGYEHALNVHKSKIPYDVETGIYCHGFPLREDDEEVFKQS
ncbi:hypothetical protein CWC12_10605 [Pseudoalteromonas ruthenica]|nr:hypothetical protein CWC12_10605 [Pseudoalteromonas ruthenica]TMP21525.1 hypothetical protein CWC06_18430 [Pseudoalteromonas ruthenica]